MRRVLLISSAMWILAAACAETHEACTVPSDCPPGYTCSSGECVPRSDADADAAGDAELPGDAPVDDAAADDALPEIPTDPTDDENEFCAEARVEYSDTQELYIVPPGARYMHVKAWGAGGNEEHAPGDCPGIVDDGGLGGYTEAVFEVSPGAQLIIIVGKLGRAGDTEGDKIRFGFGQWGGGGLSGIFLGPDLIDENSLEKALIIAGGGGGSGGDCDNPGGTGNSEEAGGMPSMLGGEGIDGVNGGGGGYHGGTGASTRGAPGMGGEGFVAASAVGDHLILYSEPGAGVPPRTDDEDYDGTAGVYESNGLVVIHFVCEVPPII
jgi:hypothetical protein